MKNLILLISLSLLVVTNSACSRSLDGVWINFVNELDQPINNVNADSKGLGRLGPKGQTGFRYFKYVALDGRPVITFNGVIDGSMLETQVLRCGTSMKFLPPGKYIVTVDTVQYDKKYFYLHLLGTPF